MSQYSPEEVARMEADHASNIDFLRDRIHDRLRMIRDDLAAVNRDVGFLREDALFDVDFEGHEQVYDDAMRQLRVGLAAVAGSVPKPEDTP